VNPVVNPIVYNMIFISVAPSTSSAYEKVKADKFWIDFLSSKYMVGISQDDDFDPYMVNLSYRDKQTALCLFMHYLDKDVVKSPDNIEKNYVGTLIYISL
jgi:hypothetical protein